MNEYTEHNLNWFFGGLERFRNAYEEADFSYLIYRGANHVALVTARLELQPLSGNRQPLVIEAGNFYGFSGQLRCLRIDPRELIEMMLKRQLPAIDRCWRLTGASDQSEPQLYRRQPSLTDNELQQQRIYELIGFGLSVPHHNTEEDDWSLRSAETPYGNVTDLMRDLRLPIGHYQFQVLAYPPLLVDATSRVRGDIAELKLRSSKHLPTEKVALGVIVSDKHNVVKRRRIEASQFTWAAAEPSDDVVVGSAEIPVPRASIVHCLAIFDGTCLHHLWVGDPDAHQNPLRTIYEVFDPNFETAIDMLTQSSTKGQSTYHEAAVSALLWVLGFAPIHLVYLPGGPDVIAVSRDYHVLVVECTLSDLQTKKQNKPQKLIDRAGDVRAALDRVGMNNSICIPVMVTARKRADVEDDIRTCERRGIVVYTQDDIDGIVNQTLAAPASEFRAQELKQRLDHAVNMQKSEERRQQDIVRDLDNVKKQLGSLRSIPNDFE